MSQEINYVDEGIKHEAIKKSAHMHVMVSQYIAV
jgi:hypothetical protein